MQVTDYFRELQEVAAQMPSLRVAYRELNRVFQKLLDEKTDLYGIRFAGPFAKTDYLLKEYKATQTLRAAVNDARVRLKRSGGQYPERQHEDAAMDEALFWHDFKAICQFTGLLLQVPVPDAVEALLPKTDGLTDTEELQQPTTARLSAYSLRVMVVRWDDTYIYAHADNAGADEVRVFYGGTSEHSVYKEWNWSYLRPLLSENCQLNLVRPRKHDGTLYPELIIYEPDYLVDISAIASCFESYSHTPLIHLLNKLKPSTSTSPILLGNLASQLLDETLHAYPKDSSYSQSVHTFFRSNALGLLTADLKPDFHAQAQKQKANIHNVVHNVLPVVFSNDGIQSFDSSEVILEPSFFSEMLGIQGRMDFLQLDQKIIIEQKSGKGGFPDQDPPLPQEKHIVQLLLYMLLLRYNHRRQYDENHHNVHILLLYSRYREGLVSLGSSMPELIFEAIKTRNGIAAKEYGYTRGGIDILSRLTADSLNTRNVKGVLWEQYQKPQLEELLSPIREASPLERAYYLRFLTFLETEHLMAKVGNQTKANSGFADKWHSSLEDKLLAGNIYYDMELVSPQQTEQGRVESLMLRFAEQPDNDISNFRTGDIVILYPYAEGTEPDARQTMVFRATIEDISGTHITLHLRAAQANANVFWHHGKMRWAIEHDFFESSFSSLYRGMHAFLSAPQQRRDLLLFQRQPVCDKTVTLTGDYGSFNPLALKVKQAKDLFIIIGPPGTGKTSYGLLNTLQEELLSPASSVLLLSYTNRAVDEICSKLVESGIDFIRIGGRYSCEEAYRPYLLDALVEESTKIDGLRQRICQTRVFVGTTTAFNSSINLFRLKTFSLAIIDEASQILEPHLIGLLSARGADGEAAIRKIVLIGDHKQLPAVVQQNMEESAVHDPLLNTIHLTDCRLSLFERLLRKHRDNPDLVYMLTKQGRMHPDIARFSSHTFYHDMLQAVPLPHQTVTLPQKGQSHDGIEDLLATRRLAFIDIYSTQETQSQKSQQSQKPQESQPLSDKVNPSEALAIAATVQRIYSLRKVTFSPTETVGVIVPYRNQIAEVRKALAKSGIPVLTAITIDTVERYQGSQRDFIIYGFTIQKRYQLDFLTSNVFEEDGCIIDRKLNVALTRAREHLIIFGDPKLLSEDLTFTRLMDHAKETQSYFSLSLTDYLEGRFTVQ